MMQTPSHSRQGFTLIELLVVISITAILIGGAIAGFMSFRDRQAAQTSAQQVWSLMHDAKNKAAVGFSPPNCQTATNTLVKYRVRYTTSTKTFDVHPVCNLGGTETQLDSINSFKVPSSVVVIQNDSTSVEFTTLFGTGNGNGYTFGSGGSLEYSFTVSDTGVISNVQSNNN